MKFSNIVKGQITQSLVKTLFERVGYRVTRFGVEELFYEVVHLDMEAYMKLKLPENLRFLPDFLIAEPDISKAFLLEVKFRKRLDINTVRKLHSVLSRQRKYWPESYCILILGESPIKDGRFHQDYIRVITPENLFCINPNHFETCDSIPLKEIYKNEEATQIMYKKRGWIGVWERLPALYNAFPLFTHNNPESYISADLLTTTIKDLNKLQ